MSVKTNLFISIFLFVFLFHGSLSIHAQTTGRNSSAQDDYMQVLTCHTNTILDVFKNDAMIPCTRDEITLTITSGSKTGATTSVNGDKNIVYKPAAGFMGHDTLEYEVICKGNAYTAKVFITVIECPDNIVETDCYKEPEGFEWAIKRDFISATVLHNFVTPIAGDLDGDGIPDIVAAGHYSDPYFQNLYIYFGNDRANPKIINTPLCSSRNFGHMAMAKVPINGVPKNIIIVACADGKLRAYDPMGTPSQTPLWVSNQNTAPTTPSMVSVHIADFDNDGIPEVYTSNRIFNAATGVLLAQGTGNTGFNNASLMTSSAYFTHAADINNDGRLELLAGTEVYSVNIPNKTGITGNHITRIKGIPDVPITGGYTVKDGATIAADINQDGKLDVLVRAVTSFVQGKRIILFAWDVEKEELIAKTDYTDNMANTWECAQAGIPFVGDVDSDGRLEISLINTNELRSFRVNSSTKTFDQVYLKAVADVSGGTGITLFDFNQDGIAELVYRDESLLRIMKADGNTFTEIKTLTCASWTVVEYPIVLDVDNDGAAEIVVVGNESSITYGPGSLRIYKSGNQYPWAPARKVWNQYAYNVVNINEDLTVPRYQMNPATFFPNGKQPYNNFLQQQTLLNTNGNTYWPLPNIVWEKEPELTIDNNTAIFEGCIKNTGGIVLQAPIYVTFYKNDTTVANIIASHTIQKTLAVGDTLCFSLSINNWSSFEPIHSVWISVNDRNGVYPYQTQCAEDGRREFPIDTSLFHVNVTVNEPDYGSATGTDDYAAYTKARAEAFVKDCYRFVNWTIDSIEVSKENPYIFTVTQNVNLVANFYALDFDTYCPTLWENTFMLNLKLLREEGYEVTGCLWFKNGEELTETNTINEFSYSAGPNQGDLLEKSPTYYTFELLTDNFGSLCSTKKTLSGSQVDKLIVYPNPVAAGAPLTIIGATKDTPINVYNLFGVCVGSAMGEEGIVKLTLNLPNGIYFIRSHNKVAKVVVMQ